jgi:YD repeat-containing protein
MLVGLGWEEVSLYNLQRKPTHHIQPTKNVQYTYIAWKNVGCVDNYRLGGGAVFLYKKPS